MDDVTNYMLNVGKPLREQVFDLRLTYGDLLKLKALARNPHPDYLKDEQFSKTFQEVFNQLKAITNYAEDRNRALGLNTPLDDPFTD